jgi:hypothetical protein
MLVHAKAGFSSCIRQVVFKFVVNMACIILYCDLYLIYFRVHWPQSSLNELFKGYIYSMIKSWKFGVWYVKWKAHSACTHRVIEWKGYHLISIVKPTRCTIFRVYWILIYIFQTVFSSIIRSPILYIQHHVYLYVIQVTWLHASGHVPASMQSTNLYDIYMMLYVQPWTTDDGRKDRPKHVEWYSINSKNCASSWFYYRNISRCTVPWTSDKI